MSRNFIAIIPARYASSRFPGKPLAMIRGKPMIQRVYEGVASCGRISAVYVATDDNRIYDVVRGFGGEAVMTSPDHASGTDRLAECARKLGLSDDDAVLNIQGDEPLFGAEMAGELAGTLDDPSVYMGTLKEEIRSPADAESLNVVKVITDVKGDAIYFSRRPIPFARDGAAPAMYRHVGVYAYTKEFLLKLSALPRTPLERAESLEQLRAIENGYRIRVAETRHRTIGVDTPVDLALVEQYMEKNGLE
jgi:3-deoxy-manno-octulosonate cytidylyltransferase (CMP-KDO synthetase)